MKKGVMAALISLGVAVIGGGCYIMLRFIRKKGKKEDEVLSVEYVFDRKEADEMLEKAIKEDPRSQIDWDPKDIPPEKFGSAVRDYPSEGEKENFESYLAGMQAPDDGDDEDLEAESDEETDILPMGEEAERYPISAGEFCNTRGYYDKVSLNYFAEDGVLADDHDEPVDHASDILGDVQELFEKNPDKDIVYIRNEKLEIDYEVCLVDGSYRHEILRVKEGQT